ncbi:MAG TPA: response regulator [Pyrinomonadaceae bacterium]|nr:response regulator [Pyrinomonadaceae bacterium]
MMENQDLSATTVMVVEDFDDTRLAMKQLLEMEGYRVVEASNGKEAVEVARRERPALVLMDLNMPVLDGFGASLHIHKLEGLGSVPIVAVTAFDTMEFRAAAKAVGCSEFVAKPINFDNLTALMDQLLKVQRAGASGMS